MAFTIRLEHTEGTVAAEASDGGAPLEDVLPGTDDRSFVCLRFIYQYVDTVFNRLQMDDFLAELERVRPRAPTPAHVRLLDTLRAFGERCKAEDLLLRFYGD
jgi:hypothetical protein